MKTSISGRAAIEQREGRRLSAYQDTRGIWTIGVGHAATGRPPHPYAGMAITEAECDALLAADLAPVEAVINRRVTVPITQNEFDALASLGFNIGVGGVGKSLVIRRLNVGDVRGAAEAFMDWAKPASLAGRRRDEMAQFLRPDARGEADVPAARAAILQHRATTTKKAAKVRSVQSGGTLAAGAVAAAALAQTHHSHFALWIGGAALIGGAIDGVVALVKHASAATLATNATKQTAAPAPAALAHPTPLSPASPTTISRS